MDIAISALVLALIGAGLALFAIVVASRTALKAKKSKPVPNGLYRVTKVGEDGVDDIFEIEEVSGKESKDGPNESPSP